MRISVLSIGPWAAYLPAAANKMPYRDRNPKAKARYAGIGTYDAGRLWRQQAGNDAPKDAAAANLDDDEHVIVVIDSHTGEVRQCRDYSGVCIAMNPWTGQSSRSATPIKLKKHSADLMAEDEANTKDAAPAPEKSRKS